MHRLIKTLREAAALAGAMLGLMATVGVTFALMLWLLSVSVLP